MKCLILAMLIVVLGLFLCPLAGAGEGSLGSTLPKMIADKADQQKTEQAPPKVFDSPQQEGTKATCPVSGEAFTITKDTVHSEYRGKYIYFCCPPCKVEFDKAPEKYLGKPKPPIV